MGSKGRLSAELPNRFIIMIRNWKWAISIKNCKKGERVLMHLIQTEVWVLLGSHEKKWLQDCSDIFDDHTTHMNFTVDKLQAYQKATCFLANWIERKSMTKNRRKEGFEAKTVFAWPNQRRGSSKWLSPQAFERKKNIWAIMIYVITRDLPGECPGF